MICSTHGIIASSLIVSSANLILDGLPVSAGAYSLRRINSQHTGFAIKVRRPSDNTEQNIGFVNNELDTVALLAFVGAGNGFVTTWYDQSTNAINATQAVAVRQPRIVLNGVVETRNWKPTVIFTNNQLLATPSLFNHPAQLSTGAVVFANTNHTEAIFQIGALNTLGSLFAELGNWTARPLVNGARRLWTNNNLTQISATYQSGTQTIRLNGVAGTNGGSGMGSATNAAIQIGTLSFGIYDLDGGISELTLFPSILSATNRQLLDTDQKAFYNTP